MRIWARAMLVVSLAALLGSALAACGGGSSLGAAGYSNPEDAVKAYFDAYEAKDYTGVVDLFTEAQDTPKNEMIDGANEDWSQYEFIEILDLELDTVFISDDEATIDVLWDERCRMYTWDQAEEFRITGTFYLKKENGKWLIQDTAGGLPWWT